MFAWEFDNNDYPHRAVPADFTFPRYITVSCLWDLWCLGNKDTGIRPFCFMRATDLPSKQCSYYFSKAKKVCKEINRIITDKRLLPCGKENIDELTIQEHDTVFIDAYEILIDTCSVGKKSIDRSGELSYISMCGLITKAIAINKANAVLTEIEL